MVSGIAPFYRYWRGHQRYYDGARIGTTESSSSVRVRRLSGFQLDSARGLYCREIQYRKQDNPPDISDMGIASLKINREHKQAPYTEL